MYLFLFFFLILYFSTIAAQNERFHNFPWLLPSNAFDPQAQIRCTGKIPRWTMNLHGTEVSIRSLYQNMRELCAKKAYGGHPRRFNAGAYCGYKFSPPTVFFERRKENVDKYFVLCQFRCRCVGGSLAEITGSRPAPEILLSELSHRSLTSMSDGNRPRAEIPGVRMPHRADFLPVGVYFLPEMTATAWEAGDGRPNHLEVVWFGPPEEYSPVICPRTEEEHFSDIESPLQYGTITNFEGSETHLLLEKEYFRRRHGSNPFTQDVCASYYYGGNPEGNAGFVCRAGTDEMIQDPATAHPAYLSTNYFENWVVAAFECRRKCLCRRHFDSLRLIWLGGQAFVYGEDTSVPLLYLNIVKDPIFDATIDYRTIANENVTRYSLQSIQSQHGSLEETVRLECPATQCTSYKDCDISRSIAGCTGVQCVINSAEARVPWFGLGSCIISTLGKRDLENPGSWQCACNSTYASSGCCGVESGIVHEESYQ